MSRNNDSGCGCIILAIAGIALIIFFALGFVGNFVSYSKSGDKGTADASGLFFLLLVGALYIVYRIFKDK
ncbi:MAG: hypothetical protein MJZ69_10815 [Bacteroidaceae bacterium]|nr:hypothetical protein [Bacteroidaceae bacterium]